MTLPTTIDQTCILPNIVREGVGFVSTHERETTMYVFPHHTLSESGTPITTYDSGRHVDLVRLVNDVPTGKRGAHVDVTRTEWE